MWERNPNNQQDVSLSLVSVEVYEEPVCLLELVCESYVWEVFVLFSVTNVCHFLNKRASVLVRCVEFFSFTEGLVVLILNKQRQPDCWWKMVSQPQGFSGQPYPSDCHVFLISHFQGIARVTLLAQYVALNPKDFHMHLEVGSQGLFTGIQMNCALTASLINTHFLLLSVRLQNVKYEFPVLLIPLNPLPV